MRSLQLNKTKGFTLIEVLVVSPVIILIIGTFIGAIVYLTGEVLTTRASNAMSYQVQDALNTIERDVQLSGAFLAQNNVPIVSPQGQNNATQTFESISIPSNSGEKLIINALATTHDPLDPARELIYTRNTPNACEHEAVRQNRVYTYNIVYFVKDNSLWRRVLLPTNYASSTVSCAPIWQQASCDPASTISNTGHCRAYDRKLVDHISSSGISVRYYQSAQSTEPVANSTSTVAATRQVALNGSRTVTVTLTGNAQVAGRTIEQSGTIRATRLGEHIPYSISN